MSLLNVFALRNLSGSGAMHRMSGRFPVRLTPMRLIGELNAPKRAVRNVRVISAPRGPVLTGQPLSRLLDTCWDERVRDVRRDERLWFGLHTRQVYARPERRP